MTRFPELVALGGIARPAEVDAAAFRRDLGELLRLQSRRLLGAMELHEKRRLLRIVQAGIGVASPHLHLVKQFDAGNRNAHLDRHDDGIACRLDRVEGADTAGDLFRNALKPQRHGRDDAEGPLGPHEKPRQVVTGGGLAGAARRADFLAIGDNSRNGKHIVFHRAITNGIGTGGARRGHTADRGIGARIDREEQAGIAQIDVEVLTRHARLHRHVKIFGIHLNDAIHPAEIDADSAVGRIDLPFKRRPRSEGNDRNLVLGASLHHGLHIIGAFGKNHAIRRLQGQIGGGVAMLLAERLARLDLVTQLLLQHRERRRNALFIPLTRNNVFQRHHPSPPQHLPVTDSIRYEIPSGGMG
ncbi:hypothetical protein D3C78_994240 [compost metagenome]